jgi:hypothetical protein
MWYKFTFSLGSGGADEVGESKTVPHPHHIDFGEEFKTLVSASPADVMLLEAVRDRAMRRVYYLHLPADHREFDAFIKRYNGEPADQPSEETTQRYLA